MREIKFRAWDKDKKQMLIPASMHFLCGQLDKVRIEEMCGVNDEGIVFKKLIPLVEYELMQFTGLKDKNGKEIYEGDIVVCVGKAGYCPDMEERYTNGVICGVITWRGISFSLDKAKEIGYIPSGEYSEERIEKLKPIRLGRMNMSLEGCSYFEIIGNIYENPELLTPKV